MKEAEYNPLDYANLTRNCVQELMTRGPWPLAEVVEEQFVGGGVYALFYKGALPLYADVVSEKAHWPIYVGKAIPAGGRKGLADEQKSRDSSQLHARLKDHFKSISAAASTLKVDDFLCRYLVVTPLWIAMAERFLIEHYQPLWNCCVDGFGNHDPGSGRHRGKISWWDVLHPGRTWAEKLDQARSHLSADFRVREFLASSTVRRRTRMESGVQD